MKVHEIMTPRARCVSPENSLVEAAGLMREMDVGALPVCEDGQLVGMITDRDLTVRGTADGRDPSATTVREVMSPGVVYVFADQWVEEIVRVMEDRQLRRLPVLNREKRLVGIVSLGDVAISSNPAFSGLALRDVSAPNDPTTRQRRLTERSRPAQLPTMPGVVRQKEGARGVRGGGARRGVSSRQKPARATVTTGRRRKSATRGGARKTPARSRTRRGGTRAAR